MKGDGAVMGVTITAEDQCWMLVVGRGSVARLAGSRGRRVVVEAWEFLGDGLFYRIESTGVEEWVHYSALIPVDETAFSLADPGGSGEKPIGLGLPWFADRVPMYFAGYEEVE